MLIAVLGNSHLGLVPEKYITTYGPSFKTGKNYNVQIIFAVKSAYSKLNCFYNTKKEKSPSKRTAE